MMLLDTDILGWIAMSSGDESAGPEGRGEGGLREEAGSGEFVSIGALASALVDRLKDRVVHHVAIGTALARDGANQGPLRRRGRPLGGE